MNLREWMNQRSDLDLNVKLKYINQYIANLERQNNILCNVLSRIVCLVMEEKQMTCSDKLEYVKTESLNAQEKVYEIGLAHPEFMRPVMPLPEELVQKQKQAQEKYYVDY